MAVWRILLLIVAALVVGDATGLIPEGDDVACTDEADGKQCPPTCPTCPCAWHALKTAPPARVELVSTAPSELTVELPAVSDARGLLAPAPASRPPIRPS